MIDGVCHPEGYSKHQDVDTESSIMIWDLSILMPCLRLQQKTTQL